ncbi:unnamed protein product [Trifolium pratense]|uniref:Uncharacterized protein n=1 Tax=Trifolium pratense TaxID=57577 RepID=A0ACB0I9U9_TRIPR|nr:unnamed protein product [Trifolium pratense]
MVVNTELFWVGQISACLSPLTVLESMELVTSRVQLYNYYYYTSVVLLNYITIVCVSIKFLTVCTCQILTQ